MLTITDDFIRKLWIHLVKDRTEVYAAFRQWQATTELEIGHRLKSVRMDNALELVKLGKELEKIGVRIERTAAYTPSQNGVAERLNRTLIKKARALLVAAELPNSL
jgi:transposase InsO family protein